MVSYDLMDAIKTPPDERVFQHYIDSAGEAVEAFAGKVTQVTTIALDAIAGDGRLNPVCTLQHDGSLKQTTLCIAFTGVWDGPVAPGGRTSAVQLLPERLDAGTRPS